MAQRRVGLIIGSVLFLMWAGYIIFLSLTPLDGVWSLIAAFTQYIFEDIFYLGLRGSKYITCVLSVFNCLACVVWMLGMHKANAENKTTLMAMTTIWICLNLTFFICFCLKFLPIFSFQWAVYKYDLIFTILQFVLLISLFVTTCRIYHSFDEEDRQSSQMFKPVVRHVDLSPSDANSLNRSEMHLDVNSEKITDDYRNRLFAYHSSRPGHDFVAVSMPNESVVHSHQHGQS